MDRTVKRYVRYAEAGVIGALALFALLTYRELDTLRRAPVYLPSYEFEISGGADPGAVIQTRGTWIAERGAPEPLQTTTIECRKSTMRCVESDAAIVFIEDRGIMQASQAEFEVDSWTPDRIVTKPRTGTCARHTLSLDLVERRASRHSAPLRDPGRCQDVPERNLELVAGYKVRGDALKKSQTKL